MSVDLGSVLLHDELYLAGQDLEKDNVASMVWDQLLQSFAKIVFEVVCAVVEFLLGFHHFYDGQELCIRVSVSPSQPRIISRRLGSPGSGIAESGPKRSRHISSQVWTLFLPNLSARIRSISSVMPSSGEVPGANF